MVSKIICCLFVPSIGNSAIGLKIFKMTIYHLKDEKNLFDNFQDLIDYVVSAGICPSAQIYRDGEPMNEYVEDYLVY